MGGPEAVVAQVELGPLAPARGGRPKKAVPKTGWVGQDKQHLSSGVILRSGRDGQGHVVRITGDAVNSDLIWWAMEHLQCLFETG